MSDFLIAGNWKMNTVVDEGIDLVNQISDLSRAESNVNIAVIPPFTHLYTLVAQFEDSGIKFGAQNCYFEESGAFTGEISPAMLKSIGCDYVLCGHSERRTIFGETDEIINWKLKSVLKLKMLPILCIGETLEERETGLTKNVLERQLMKGLSGLKESELSQIIIAYEPVWAIGTGVSASEEQADEAHTFIREFIIKQFGDFMKNNYLLYGGSMKPENAEQLLKLPDVNGGLIGGASLKAKDFSEIIDIANKL